MIISADSEAYDPLAMSPWEVSDDGETWTRVEDPRGHRYSRFNVALNGPQTKAHQVFGPDRNICLPWGRGIGKSHFMRLLWYLSVAQHDGKRRFGFRNGLRTETRGVKIVHIQPTFKSIKDVHADLADQEVYKSWAFLGGRINHSEWKISFPGGSWIQWFGMKEANAARGIRCDFVTADEGDDIDLGAIQAVVKPWFSAPWSLRQFVVGGTPRRGRYGLLYSMHEAGAIKHTPKCYSFHATYKDAPERLILCTWKTSSRRRSPRCSAASGNATSIPPRAWSTAACGSKSFTFANRRPVSAGQSISSESIMAGKTRACSC